MKPFMLFYKIIGLCTLCILMQSSFAAMGSFASTNPGVVSNRLSQQSQSYHNQTTKKNQRQAPIVYKKNE